MAYIAVRSMPRFLPDPDPAMLRLARRAHARAVRNEDTEPMASLTLQSRRVDPPVDPTAPSQADLMAAFVRTLGPPYRTDAGTLRLVTVDRLEAELWSGLAHGLVCEPGPFEGEADEAQTWIAELYLAVADGAEARCYAADGLVDRVMSRSHLLLGPRRVVVVTQIGWD